ncbi:unknown [Firmicutes bacterium CAG:83]|nr:unknown [Firmicutes bacterium CAG:83]
MLPRTGYCQIPLRTGGSPSGAGLRHPHGGDGLLRPHGGLRPLPPDGALQSAPPAAGHSGGYAPGTAGRQFQLHQPPSSAGAGAESGGGGAEHPVSEPPGQQPSAAVSPVRLCSPVSPVQRLPHLPLRQRADDVPLLRPLPACTGYLSRLRRRYEAHRLRYTEGGGGADPALSRYRASADGCRYRGRGPREAPAGVPAPPHPHSAGDSDGGQGTGFRRGDAGGRAGGGSVAVRGSLPGGGAHLQPADAGGGPGRPGGEGGPSGDSDLHPPQRRDPGGGGAGL